MTPPTGSYDWAGARGEKWRAQLTGMEAMLAPIDEPLIHALQLDAPCRIADLACGGGGTTLEIQRRAPAGSVVHGFDISPALVETARARVPSDPRGIAFAVADMASGPAPDAPYDRLVSRFGVMFFDDPPAAFANLVRWIVPGGRVAFAVWAPSADNPWHSNVRAAAAEVIAMPASDPEAPGPFRYAEADKLLTLLARAGLVDLAVRDWRGAFAIGGGRPAAEAAQFAIASSSVSDLLAAAGAEALDQAHRALTARFARHEQGGVVRLDARVHLVTGARQPALA